VEKLEPTKLVMKRETVEIEGGRKLYNYTFEEVPDDQKVVRLRVESEVVDDTVGS
jgi:hypothetical protein